MKHSTPTYLQRSDVDRRIVIVVRNDCGEEILVRFVRTGIAFLAVGVGFRTTPTIAAGSSHLAVEKKGSLGWINVSCSGEVRQEQNASGQDNHCDRLLTVSKRLVDWIGDRNQESILIEDHKCESVITMYYLPLSFQSRRSGGI